jgi:hypothetical protein
VREKIKRRTKEMGKIGNNKKERGMIRENCR